MLPCHISGDAEIEHLCQVKTLLSLDISASNVRDSFVEKISCSLVGLTSLNFSSTVQYRLFELTDVACSEHLKKLSNLREIDFSDCCNLTLQGLHSLVMNSRRNGGKLKRIRRDAFQDEFSAYAQIASSFLQNPPTWRLDFSHTKLTGKEIPLLLELLEEESCDRIEEVETSKRSGLTRTSFDLIGSKMKNLKRIIFVVGDEKFSKEEIETFKEQFKQCEIIEKN